jgi:hypothetical protein
MQHGDWFGAVQAPKLRNEVAQPIGAHQTQVAGTRHYFSDPGVVHLIYTLLPDIFFAVRTQKQISYIFLIPGTRFSKITIYNAFAPPALFLIT